VRYLPHGTRILVGENPHGLDAIVRSWDGELDEKTGAPRWVIAEIRADWRMYGTQAGPLRNGWILDRNPSLVLAFHRSLEADSKGTRDMVKQAQGRGIPVLLFEREFVDNG
jgi:hypothetical protein